MIITFGTIKGGVGKTTLVTNLTYMRAVLDKKRVLLVDTDDDQWSAADWVEQRKGKGIETRWETIKLSGKDVRTELKKVMSDYDDILIDTAGRDSQSLRAALTISDVLVCPFQPRAYDVWTINKLDNLLKNMSSINTKLKTYTLINRGDISGPDNDDAKQILSEVFTCLPIVVCQRKSFSNSTAKGMSVFEYKKPIDKKARQELKAIYDIIFTSQ